MFSQINFFASDNVLKNDMQKKGTKRNSYKTKQLHYNKTKATVTRTTLKQQKL